MGAPTESLRHDVQVIFQDPTRCTPVLSGGPRPDHAGRKFKLAATKAARAPYRGCLRAVGLRPEETLGASRTS